MRFDGEEAAKQQLAAGIPQGSPLSPILFILYIATLYEHLQRDGLLVAGFADDTNLLVCGDATVSVRRLESAWTTCEAWAKTRGMTFAPEKSELMHFTRVQKPAG